MSKCYFHSHFSICYTLYYSFKNMPYYSTKRYVKQFFKEESTKEIKYENIPETLENLYPEHTLRTYKECNGHFQFNQWSRYTGETPPPFGNRAIPGLFYAIFKIWAGAIFIYAQAFTDLLKPTAGKHD